MTYARTSAPDFRATLQRARDIRPQIADATTAPAELPSDARYYLAADRRSGYGIADRDELIAVWSLHKGRGADLVRDAIVQGARRLDCFDGYLPAFYARHGFRETAREPNWEPGGPDVVYMEWID